MDSTRRKVIRSLAGVGGGALAVTASTAATAAGTGTAEAATTPAGWINVMTMGAKGDGSTDDTAAIQAALDAVPAGGGVVYFPNAVYEIVEAV